MAVSLGLGTCGSDDAERAQTTATAPARSEGEATATSRGDADVERIETETTRPEPPKRGARTGPETGRSPSPSPSPERRPGGAGDEEPARTLALLTGDDGRISPPVVRVPAFISIRVELRSADGRPYGLEFKGETASVRLRTSGRLGSVSGTIDGLRPGETITGTPLGARNRVRIEATAEPGP